MLQHRPKFVPAVLEQSAKLHAVNRIPQSGFACVAEAHLGCFSLELLDQVNALYLL